MGKLSMIGQMKKEAERDFTKFVKYVAELEEENKKLKSERDNFMLKYSKAVEEKVVETNKLCTERNKLEEANKKLKSDLGTVIDERDNAFKKIEQLKERIKELETDYNRLKVAFEDVVSGK